MNKGKNLKIGLDYHGVISQNPDYFKGFAYELMRRGHELHIVTGGPCDEVSKFLRQQKFCYTQIFAIFDHYESMRIVEHYKNGGFYIDDELWNSAKAKYCIAQHINLHIDDSCEYLKYFVTPYCLYDKHSNRCSLDHHPCLDFSMPPYQAIKQLEKLFIK